MMYLVTEYDYADDIALLTIRKMRNAPLLRNFRTFDEDGLRAYITGRFSEEYAAYVMQELRMGNAVKIPVFKDR